MPNILNMYRDPLFIDWYITSQGNKISIKRENEQYKVVNNHIVLAEIMDEYYGVNIEGMVQVKWGSKITNVNQFAPNFHLGIIKLHPDKEGSTITINSYYSRGLIMYPGSRIYIGVENNNITQTVSDFAKEITENNIIVKSSTPPEKAMFWLDMSTDK